MLSLYHDVVGGFMCCVRRF